MVKSELERQSYRNSIKERQIQTLKLGSQANWPHKGAD